MGGSSSAAPGGEPLYPAQPPGMWCGKCNTFNPAPYRRCVKCRAPLVRRASPWLIVAFSAAFLLVIVGLGRLFTGGGAALPTFTLPSPAVVPPEDPLAEVSIRRFSWRKEESGSVMVGNFTVRNDNPFPVENIGIQCQVSARDGSAVAYLERTIRGPVPPGIAKNFPDITVGNIEGRISRAGCRVKSVEKGF